MKKQLESFRPVAAPRLVRCSSFLREGPVSPALVEPLHSASVALPVAVALKVIKLRLYGGILHQALVAIVPTVTNTDSGSRQTVTISDVLRGTCVMEVINPCN